MSRTIERLIPSNLKDAGKSSASEVGDATQFLESPQFMNWTILHNYPGTELEEHWREFLTRADFPAHYVSPEYFREPFFRDKDPFAILAWHEGKIVAALTALHDAEQVICGQGSRPQACFDKSIDPAIAAESLTAGLLAEAHSAALITLYTWSPVDSFLAQAYRVEQEEGVVIIDLMKGPESLFKGLSSNRRTNVRTAIRRGVEVAAANTREEFWTYYEIYIEWCGRKNLVPSPFETLEEAFSLPDNRRLFLARFEGKIIAGVVIRLYPKGMVEYAANCSIKENLRLKPNDLLHWRVIEWACREGYSSYSLGGAHLFLRKMGGTVVPVYRYRLDRTCFRRHELQEALRNSGRKIFHVLPGGLQIQVKRALGRDG
jgi:hypothetical protein